ncbi:hypothetical protein L7F22_009622 [Adiantum nelumboides]|nr:hypothetical protein [Adiantum nelumboides]
MNVKLSEVSDVPKAVMVTASKAGSVGGARRVMRGAVAVSKVEPASQRKMSDEKNSSKTATGENVGKSNSLRRLGMKEAAPIAKWR